MPRQAIAVIGAGTCDADTYQAARTVGRCVAQRGMILITGGLTGVMEAASIGAHDAGGLVIGILPGSDAGDANPAVDVAIPTGMGQLRNGLVVASADAVIAVRGEWGTLSEIGFAVKLDKPTVAWRSWEMAQGGVPRHDVRQAATPESAVDLAVSMIDARGRT